MSVTRWIAAVVVLVLVQSVVATNIAGQTTPARQFNYAIGYLTLGAGAIDCGTMTSDLRTNRVSFRQFYLSWGQGFITGINSATYANKAGNPHVGENTSPEALFAAMEQYCGQHPLEDVVNAGESVYAELAARSVQAVPPPR